LCELSSSSVSFIGKISPNFNLKNLISTYTQVFLSWRKWRPNLPHFEERKFQIAQFLKVSSIRKSRIQKEFVFSLLSYLVCSQIRLKYFLDDCHFDNITKPLKETLLSRCQSSGHTQDRVDCNSVPLTHPHRSRRAMIKAWWTSLCYNRDNKQNRNISIVSTYYYIPEPEAFWCIHQYL